MPDTPAPAPTLEPNIVESAGGRPFTPPKTEIHIGATPPDAAKPADPPKPGSARERVQQAMHKRFGGAAGSDNPTKPADAPAPPKVEGEAPKADIPKDTSENPTSEQDQRDPGKKPNPWRIVDDYKGRLSKAEEKIAELTKRAISEEDFKAATAQREALEKRNKELEEEIRFTNYQKSSEFAEKHERPYQEAWKRAMSELSEVSVNDETGQRQATPEDLLQLVNLPLGKAREVANAVFGEFADDAMAHRKEIRRLFDEQTAALESARKGGEERENRARQETAAATEQMNKAINETWAAANEAVTKDEKYGQFFTPREGDQDGNQRLAKGFELADRAFRESPLAPGLTPEQRKDIVRRHAAVRNRAAAFGRLANDNHKLRATIADLEAKLKGYNSSAPANGDGKGRADSAGRPAGAMDRMREELRKRAS